MDDQATSQIRGRSHPHSLEAEQAVLGGVLLNNRAMYDVSEALSAEDFYRPAHRAIWSAMLRLMNDGQPLDPVLVAQNLRAHEELDGAGGLNYLAELTENTPSAQNTMAYAEIVRERSVLRQLITVSQTIADSAFRPEGRKAAEILEAAEQQIFEIQEDRQRNDGPKAALELFTSAIKRLEELAKNKNPVTGLPTGFTDLDVKTAGLQPGDLIIAAGRPSMGKTSFMMNMAEKALMTDTPGAVVVFSMEMPAEGLVMRMISSLGRIDQTRLRTGDLQDDDWARITSAFHLMREKQLYIDDSPALSPMEVRTRCRRIAIEQKTKIKLIVLDYLQLMRSSEKVDNRTLEISEISRNLKAIAKDLKCPVIAGSQLNRSLEQRADKRPMMSDLRESGAIEQDADLILFIYRDEVYNPESPDKGVAEIIIGKQRNGPIGMVKLAFIGKLTKFENLAPTHYGVGQFERFG